MPCMHFALAVMAMSGIGMVIGGIPSGYLLDNFPGHVVLGACHLVQAAGFLLMPLCRSVLSLAAVFGTISITFIVVNTALNCLSIWVTTPSGDGNDGPVSTAFLLNSIRSAPIHMHGCMCAHGHVHARTHGCALEHMHGCAHGHMQGPAWTCTSAHK
eukprot:366278-Chlamydomonas_euryale.AAC.57